VPLGRNFSLSFGEQVKERERFRRSGAAASIIKIKIYTPSRFPRTSATDTPAASIWTAAFAAAALFKARMQAFAATAVTVSICVIGCILLAESAEDKGRK
jgi:hypothetical protein